MPTTYVPSFSGVFSGYLVWKDYQDKTANYAMAYKDSGIHFSNAGAVGPIVFTLPPIAANLRVCVRVVADQNVTVQSNEGANIVAFNNAAATSLAFSTGGARIGGCLAFQSNQLGTLWYVDVDSAGANTVTVA